MLEPDGAKTASASPLKIILPIGVLCLVVGILAMILLPDRTPKLDLEILQANRALWSGGGAGDYDISITIRIDRQEESRATVSVRNGEIVSQSYNGLARAGKDDSYTIEGLFKIMERELKMAQEAKEKSGTVLKAKFDDRLGFPVVFKRLTTRPGARSCVISIVELRSKDSGILFSTEQP